MRRYVHKALAVLLCMCLLVSSAPLTAFAITYDAVTSVGDTDLFVEGQATTQVNIRALGFEIIGQSENIVTSVEAIEKDEGLEIADQKYVLKVVLSGADPEKCTYKWTRTIGKSETPDASFEDTRPEYPLIDALDAGQLSVDEVYSYNVEVFSSENQESVSTTIKVVISNTYETKTLTHDSTNIQVTGAINKVLSSSDFSVLELDASSPTFALLQAAAPGKKVEHAYHLVLAGVVALGKPSVGPLTVSFPVDFAAAGEEVTVVGLGESRAAELHPATVQASSVTVEVASLGAFALATPAASTFEIESSATEGGTITPLGKTAYAQGAKPPYVMLPNSGYAVEKVEVDGQAVELVGNSYTFDSLDADHTIHATFKEQPHNPSVEFDVSAQVEGSGGRVGIDGSSAEATCTKKVAQGTSAWIQFAPDAGYIIDEVTIQVGDSPAAPYVVFSNAYLLSAVSANTTIKVSYKLGIDPPAVMHKVSTEVVSGQGTISPEDVEVTHAGSATFTLMPAPGYRVSYAEVEGRKVALQGSVLTVENVIAACTVKVAFVPSTPAYIKVYASAGEGGSISPAGEVEVPYSSSQVFSFLPEAGWVVDEVRVDDVLVQTGGASYQLSEVMAETRISVSFKKGEGSHPEYCPVRVTVAEGEGGELSVKEEFFVRYNEPKTVYAYAQKGYILEEVRANGASIPFELCSKDNLGTLAVRSASQRATAQGITTYSFVVPSITEETSIVVRFVPGEAPSSDDLATRSVEAFFSEGGVISPSGLQEIPEGGRAEFTLRPDEGYHLVSLTIQVEGQEPIDITDKVSEAGLFTLDNIRSNFVLKAMFVSEHAIVSASASGGGAISPAGETRVVRGGSQTFALLPDEGYELESVLLDGAVVQTAGEFYTLTNIQTDCTVEARYKPAENDPSDIFTISAAVHSVGGRVSPEGSVSVARGGTVMFSFIPDEGYRVASVKVDGVALPYQPQNYLFTDVQQGHTLEVTFEVGLAPGVDPNNPWVKLDTLYKRLAQTGDLSRGVGVGLVAIFAGSVAVVAHGIFRRKVFAKHK